MMRGDVVLKVNRRSPRFRVLGEAMTSSAQQRIQDFRGEAADEGVLSWTRSASAGSRSCCWRARISSSTVSLAIKGGRQTPYLGDDAFASAGAYRENLPKS